jgi:phytoene dehydrogenase-like protein
MRFLRSPSAKTAYEGKTIPLMSEHTNYDAIVVGAGPNGLAAAIELARAGRSVLVLEAALEVGGGVRSAALTLPGFVHDVCSAIHPLGAGSPFLRALPLAEHGLAWTYSPAPLAHPLDDGTAILLERSIAATAAGLGRDGAAYRRLVAPLVRGWEPLVEAILAPLRLPRHPLALARFGMRAVWPARALAERLFSGERARALFAGMAAHAIMPLEWPLTSAFGVVMLVLGHAVGWPFPQGGAQRLADALASYLASLGGEIRTGSPIASLDQLPPARAVLFDLAPRQVRAITGERLPAGYARALGRYRHGPGVFKIDWALDGPIPWRAPECARAATLHLGGTLAEIADAEAAVWRGEHPERPFVLLSQPSLFDLSRAPAGKHTAWAYCHVPNSSAVDMTEQIEGQIERFAPGFRRRVLARSAMGPAAMERHNANYIGGDISGGVQDVRQLFTRPVARLDPYTTPAAGIYICSSSTPPGGGVHGMCGYWAARSALRDLT